MFLAVALPTCLQVISYAVRGYRWKKTYYQGSTHGREETE